MLRKQYFPSKSGEKVLRNKNSTVWLCVSSPNISVTVKWWDLINRSLERPSTFLSTHFLLFFSVNELLSISMLKWEIPWIRAPKTVLLFCKCWFKQGRRDLQNWKIAEQLLPTCPSSAPDDLWSHSWHFRRAKTALWSLSCLAQRSEQGSGS